ncbi:MAG: 6,7-dimethyl-8-ribityllumazine synthase [Bacteroidia bacterium]|nr:6,7-dimethyl-8-ribityllumazine synthase [Bacteroidia bacterium]
MSSHLKNLSNVSDNANIPNAKLMRFGIVVSEWNSGITYAMYRGAVNTLIHHGSVKKNISTIMVPGSFELVLGAQQLLKKKNIDAVICLGCVIKGETPHFDFICNAVSNGIINLNIKYNTPVIFGVLTTNNMQQAEERSGGSLGNKGDEAAVTAIQMVAMKKQ